MITIEPELKEAFNPNGGQGGRYVDYGVRFEVVNQGAQEEGVPEAAQDNRISRLAQILNRVSDKALDFATFEPGGWPLDGSKVIPPRVDEMSGAEICLIMPDLSDANGYYATPQVIVLATESKHDLLAITLDFGYSPASDFTIDLYDGENLLYHHTVIGNEYRRYLMRQAVSGIDRVMVTIARSLLPYRKARLVEFVYGVMLEYGKANSESLAITEVIDPLNERVPAGEANLVVDNFSRDFNLFDPASLYAYFQDRQLLIPRIGAQTANGSIGYVDMGKYYLQRPQLRGNLSKLELRAIGTLGVLSETTYSRGIYKTASFAVLAEEVANDAGVSVSCPESFASTTVTGYIPSVSHAEAFRLIAQATNTLLSVSRSGVITFSEIGEDVLQTLTADDYRMGGGFSPSDDAIINTVSVEVAALTVNPSIEELAKVGGAGTHHIKYSPSLNQGGSIVGGEIVSADFYADNAVVTITGGTLTVSGNKVQSGKSTVAVTRAQPGERQYVYEVKGNNFIQLANAPAVAQHYLSLKALHRKTVKMEYRGYPYLEMGDVVAFNTGAMDTQPFIVTKNALRVAGGMTGTLETRERP